VAGPTLVVRVPGVKVWHRVSAKGLRIPITESWEPGTCSSAPVMDNAWHDPEQHLVLLRLTGSDHIMDACGYRRLHRVLSVPSADLPALPWTRAPSKADIFMAGEEIAGL
jgi:hypothetical protein